MRKFAISRLRRRAREGLIRAGRAFVLGCSGGVREAKHTTMKETLVRCKWFYVQDWSYSSQLDSGCPRPGSSVVYIVQNSPSPSRRCRDAAACGCTATATTPPSCPFRHVTSGPEVTIFGPSRSDSPPRRPVAARPHPRSRRRPAQ